ncbi:Hypothetical protein, putative [Bodo saltans]|uniref:Uncharacterized protein n=1 Tax=Bodo saltans TaxID=75058 RepID=A0A0S4J957_BODSA|nr:Hypothetical protein, putative [Bodo saltans]|eukprot:CUG88042.1 Hypothetical protein, putative [Bodo saltans]
MTVDHRRVSSAPDGATTSAGVTPSLNNNKQSANIGSLRHNAFQWRNLYHHRYGIATYPPPVPRNPSTTTGTYPNVDAYMTLREQEANNTNAVRKSVASTVLDAVGSLVAAKNRSGSQDQQATSDGLSPNLRQQARNALFTRSSFLIQRKAQLLLNKKREVEELRKQNPHALEQCILTIHQKAWTLLIDDSVTKATALEAKDYGDAAREMKERLQEQMRRNLMAMDGDSPFALDGPEDRSHSGNRGGGGGQEGVSPTSARSNSPGVLRHGDHALPSGATNPIHTSIAAERDRRLNLLSEFAPFFAVISPPTVVSAMHSQATPVYGRYALPVPGGSGDTVGLPLFSQYNTWEEACRQREAWPRAPFHFFMSRDVSFHHANVAAAVLMLETVARFLHRHRCIHPPQEQPAASDDPMRRRGTALGRSKSTVGITIGDPSSLLGATTTITGGSNLPNIQGISGDQPPPPPPQPEFWDGHRRVAPDTKCSTLFNPSSCPYLAMEQLTEDIIVVFEHAGARNALPMTLSMIRLFLDKALRPGLSTQLFGKTALLDVYFNDNTKDRDDLSASGSSGDEGGGTGHQRMRGGGGGAPFGASGSHAAAGLGGSLRTSGVPPALAHLLAPLSRTTSNSNNNTLRSSSLAGNQQQQPNSNNGTMPPPPRRPLDESSSSSSDDEDDTGGKRSVGGASLFSEREFHALFTLSLWFLDSATATAVSAPMRSAAVASAGNNRKKSRIAQPQAPKMAPGYTRIQNTARAPTLGIAEAVVRFEAARKIRIKAIRRRERQLHEEAQQKAIQYREDLEKERIREQDELRRRQIMAMHQVHNQHHQKSPNHSGGGGPMSSKENSFKGSSMGGHSGGHLGASNKSHTAVPPPSALHASVSQNSSSHSTSLHNNNNDVAESASLSRQKPRGDDPTSLKLVIPPQVVDSDDEVDFFVDVSKRSSKFGPMIQSTMLGDTATTPRAVVGESPASQFLVAPSSAGGGPRGQRHTLLPNASSGGSSVLTRTTSPVAAIAVPTITHLAPPPASIAIPPTAEENAAAIRKLVLSLRCAVDDEMPAAATKLATPFIMMSSYMKLHGVGWCKDVCRSLLDYLSYPDIFLYVTDDDLVQPPMPCDDQRSPSQQRSGTGATPRAAHTAAANGKSPSNDPLGQPAGTNALGLLPPQRPHTTTINTSHRSNSEIGGGDQLTPFAQAASQSQRRASSYFTTMGPVVFSRAGSVATDSHQSPRNELTSTGVADPQETSSSRLSISMLGNQISPRAQPPQQWKFPIEDDAALETPGGGVKNLSVSTADPMSLPTNELSLRAGPIEGSTISPKAGGGGNTPQTSSHPQGGPGLPFSTDGLDPAMTTFLNAMLRKESSIVEHIQKALEIWFETLEGSHASQKVPSGIAYLLTAMCASVHSHLLSGVVMSSALEVDGLEPDSIEFVDHLIATLVASTTPSASSSSTASTSLPTPSQRTMASPGSPAMETQQRRASVASSAEGGGGGAKLPAPPSGAPHSGAASASVPSSRRRATVILDPHDIAKEQEPSPGLMVVPPTPAFSTRAGAVAQEPQSPLTAAAAAEASTAPPSPSPGGANNSGTISLVSDVQTFRLAKFILFDVWLLPMLNLTY